MDSWYSAKALLKQMRSYDWHFVTRLKKNRNFNGRRLSRHWPHRFGHARGSLSGGLEVLIVKDGKRYLATSDLTLDVREVKALYGQRQQVEEFFKILRGQLRWGQSPARSQAAQMAHLHLCLMAYCVLETEAFRQHTTIYRLRRALFRQEVPRQSPLLDHLAALRKFCRSLAKCRMKSGCDGATCTQIITCASSGDKLTAAFCLLLTAYCLLAGQPPQALFIRRAGDAAFGDDGRDVTVRRDIEGGVGDLDAVRRKLRAFDVRDFVIGALFNRNLSAGLKTQIERRNRRTEGCSLWRARRPNRCRSCWRRLRWRRCGQRRQ